MNISRQLQQIFLLEELDETIRLDSSKLVREIKNYPIIYDNNFRRDQTTLFNAWENVCAGMVPNFNSMTESEKIATRKRLRDRWSYMRSTFRRDILSNRIDCHKHLCWVQEINFLAPILRRPPQITNISKNFIRRAKYKSISKKKTIYHNATSAKAEYTCTSVKIQTPKTHTITKPEAREVNTIETSVSDVIISCDSSASDNASEKSTLDSTSSSTTEIAEEDEFQNDLVVESFMSTFSVDSVLTSPVDSDQMFLLTLLQNYRLVRSENKEALQHKFYTFLRD